ncbi:unnamed protein product [Staurois parvus]|uniref:Uncharacterized protein n=1 Tax=Staurois parvus TaxID=386267 RepID=A0ABN9BTL1_9NEOB|nr:unnamed protein product [Staurois parvus]
MPISATYQCCQSVPAISASYQPPISASQCRLTVQSVPLSVPISDACQCPSVPPISAHHYGLISMYKCCQHCCRG